MSLEDAARKIADRLRTMDYVEVYSHHDADGIEAAAILTIALQRADIAFLLRFLPHLKKEDVVIPEQSILCDLGASIPDWPESTMIIDHHVPYANTAFHINPRLEGMDGETELSAAGCAYLVAKALGDNRDLASLVLVGIIGDSQKFTGKNHEILEEALMNNLVEPKRGVLLAGRTIGEQLECATLPFLKNISGDAKAAAEIETICTSLPDSDSIAGRLVSEIAVRSDASYHDLMAVYGDNYRLLREVIQDAYALTAVIDACGKSGRTDLGYAVAAGDLAQVDDAWNTALSFRRKVINAVNSAEKIASAAWKVSSYDVASDVADILAKSLAKPVIVIGKAQNYLKISARAPAESNVDFEQFMKQTAETFGGYGGGHKTRAGGEIPLSSETEFITTLEVFA